MPFGKKNCDLCGGKIGMLGNRKLDDATAARTAQNNCRRFSANEEEAPSRIYKRSSNTAKRTKRRLRHLTPHAHLVW